MSSAARRTTCVRTAAAGGTFDDMLGAGAGGSSRRPSERPVVVGRSAVGSGCDHATEEEVRGVLAGTCQARGSARARFRENGFVSAIRGSRTEGEYGGARARDEWGFHSQIAWSVGHNLFRVVTFNVWTLSSVRPSYQKMPFSVPCDVKDSLEQQHVRRRPRLRVADVRVRYQLCGLWTAPTVANIASKGIAWATIASKGTACDPIASQLVLRSVHWNARLRLRLRQWRPLRRRWRQHRALRLPVWHRPGGLRPARTAAWIARLRRLLEAKSVRPQPVPRLGLPHALHPAGERHELDTA